MTGRYAALQTAAFYPTLLYNVIRSRINRRWTWHNRIDETVILGALPFKESVEELKNTENVGGVVCLNLPHEIENPWAASESDWKKAGVSFYWLPTPDFIYAPAAKDVHHAVLFIESFESSGKSVYVHCKAGRTRSATVAACYLIHKHKWTCEEAIDFLISKRHQVLFRSAHMETIRQYFEADRNNTFL